MFQQAAAPKFKMSRFKLLINCVVGIIVFHVEAQSLTCDNTTDVCPGTELTCTCSVMVSNNRVIWRLPGLSLGSETIALEDKVGSNSTTTNGIFFAVITKITEEVLESMLIYTASATESLVDGTIMCSGNEGAGAVSTTITILAG